MQMTRLPILLLAALFLVGCGPAFLPVATTKPVSEQDIVGTWEYRADYGETEVRLELKEDGTFVQTIHRKGESEKQVHSGKWELEGAFPRLAVLKPVFGDTRKPWVVEDVNWWIIDSVRNKDREFSICGAADDRDPDSFFEMRVVP